MRWENTTDRINSRLAIAKERTNELKDTVIETIQNKTERRKNKESKM